MCIAACVTVDGSRSGGKKLIKISARSGKQFPRGHGEVECDDARLKFLTMKLLARLLFQSSGFLCRMRVCNAWPMVILSAYSVCSFIKISVERKK